MDTASAEAAFRITPTVTGAFAWAGGNAVMYWKPDTGLSVQTTYTLRSLVSKL